MAPQPSPLPKVKKFGCFHWLAAGAALVVLGVCGLYVIGTVATGSSSMTATAEALRDPPTPVPMPIPTETAEPIITDDGPTATSVPTDEPTPVPMPIPTEEPVPTAIINPTEAPVPTTEAVPAGGLGITRADTEAILTEAGMVFKSGTDIRGLKRTQGARPRSFDSAELIGPDTGLVYIYLTFDAPTVDAIGPAMGDRYLEPLTEAIGDPELAAWCRFRIMDFRAAIKKDEIFTVEDVVNGRKVGIQAMLATPGALVSCWMGELPE